MKHSHRFYRLLALILVCAALFSACGERTVELKLENGAFRNTKNGVAYREASANYRATSLLEGEVLFLATGVLSDGVPLYAIENIDSKNFITDENYTLYYNEAITLPTLAEMKPYIISCCVSNGNMAQELGRLDENDQAAIDDLVDILTQGTTFPKEKLLGYSYDRYELLFHSKEYPGFFYVLEYWKYEESFTFTDGDREYSIGKGVVYDRGNDCFYIMGDILENYFDNASS